MDDYKEYCLWSLFLAVLNFRSRRSKIAVPIIQILKLSHPDDSILKTYSLIKKPPSLIALQTYHYDRYLKRFLHPTFSQMFSKDVTLMVSVNLDQPRFQNRIIVRKEGELFLLFVCPSNLLKCSLSSLKKISAFFHVTATHTHVYISIQLSLEWKTNGNWENHFLFNILWEFKADHRCQASTQTNKRLRKALFLGGRQGDNSSMVNLRWSRKRMFR